MKKLTLQRHGQAVESRVGWTLDASAFLILWRQKHVWNRKFSNETQEACEFSVEWLDDKGCAQEVQRMGKGCLVLLLHAARVTYDTSSKLSDDILPSTHVLMTFLVLLLSVRCAAPDVKHAPTATVLCT